MSTSEEILNAAPVKFKRKVMKGNVNLTALNVGEVEPASDVTPKADTPTDKGWSCFFISILMILLDRK
jgi:hypothetical protein